MDRLPPAAERLWFQDDPDDRETPSLRPLQAIHLLGLVALIPYSNCIAGRASGFGNRRCELCPELRISAAQPPDRFPLPLTLLQEVLNRDSDRCGSAVTAEHFSVSLNPNRQISSHRSPLELAACPVAIPAAMYSVSGDHKYLARVGAATRPRSSTATAGATSTSGSCLGSISTGCRCHSREGTPGSAVSTEICTSWRSTSHARRIRRDYVTWLTESVRSCW